MASSAPKKDIVSSIRSVEKDGEREQHSSRDEATPRGSLDIDSTHYKGTFETIGDPSFYRPIQQYEGKHRYDPKFQWEPKEERRLVRKVIESA